MSINDDQFDHSAGVGAIAANWEFVLETIELALLHLAACPDYRGRALTNRMSFHSMMRAFRSLLRDKFDDDFVGEGSEYKKLLVELTRLNRERNRFVHASWLESTEGTIAYVSADPNQMTATEKSADVAELKAIAEQISHVRDSLVGFLVNQCEFSPSPDIFEWPHPGKNHPQDQR